MDVNKLKEMKKASQKAADKILKKIIKPGMKDWEKEISIHNYIVENCEYDRNKKSYPADVYMDYGVLISKKAVCEGYAKAMYRLLNSAGVKCLYIAVMPIDLMPEY